MPINIEYLIHSHQPLTPEKRTKIYQILMTYAFPMSTNPLNQIHIEKLSTIERKMLEISEHEFLQRKIRQEVSNSITVSTIPKSLYQLYSVVYLYTINSVELPQFNPTAAYTNDEEMYQFILEATNNVQQLEIWWNINQALVKNWKNTLADIDSFVETQMDALSNAIEFHFDKIPQSYLSSTSCGRALAGYLKTNPPFEKLVGLLKRVALEEISEREHYLLYCAATGEDKQKFIVNAGVSWSFNNGLMSGFLYDLNTGCSINYMASWFDPRELWSLTIKKNTYQFDNASVEKNIIYIPPVSALLRLSGTADFHHPRTKVSTKSNGFLFGTYEFNSRTIKNKIHKQPVFIANELEPSVYETALRVLCEENYCVLPTVMHATRTSPVFGFQFSNFKRAQQMTDRDPFTTLRQLLPHSTR